MTINKWPASEPACFGVCCSLHRSCVRYAAADFNSNPGQVFTDHCGPAYPLYIDSRKTEMLGDLAAKAGQA